MSLEGIYNAIIVKPIETEETSYGGIIVPDLGSEKNKLGEVIAVGPGKYSVTGEFLPTTTQVGEIVILPTMGFTKLEHNGEEYFIGAENQILAEVIKEEE